MEYKKKLGQNFLVNEKDINEFINFCSINSDNVLEIGVGDGALTKRIIDKSKNYFGIEIDNEWFNKAVNQYATGSISFINTDFLSFELYNFIEKNNVNKIIGAIPYYISSPIIHKILKEAHPNLKEVYLITQKEFAQKVIGSKNRSYFTNLIEKYAKIEPGKIILKDSFNPMPKVDSMCFKLEFYNYPTNEEEVVTWSKFLHHVFLTPRKKINKRFDKSLLESLNINQDIRPEDLSLNEINLLYKND